MTVSSGESKLVNWCELVKQARPDRMDSPHPIIYQVKLPESNLKYEVQSPEQNVHSSSYRKCSLSEIISTTCQVAAPFLAFQKNDFMPNLQLLIHKSDPLSPAVTNQFVSTLAEQVLGAIALKGAIESLQIMQQSAERKQLAQKMSGIWGRIKWFIWSCFFNHEAKIKKLERQAPEPMVLINTVSKELHERILINMSHFIEQTEAKKTLDITNPKIRKKYATPTDIEEKWIASYNADKYDLRAAIQKRWKEPADKVAKRVSEMEKTRDRVIILTKLWKDLL